MDDVDVLVRQGATLPLRATITDQDGGPVDLTDATVQVVVSDWQFGAELWRNDATPDPDQVANTGRFSYAWRPVDVATPGNYRLELEVTFAGGQLATFPSEAPLTFTVAEPQAQLDPLVVDARSVARRIGIPDAALDETTIDLLEDLILDAQTDVEGYLRRPLGVLRFTELARWDPTEPGSGPLAQTWSRQVPGAGLALRWDPVVQVLSTTDNGDGTVLVSYLAGLDMTDRRHRPILRYVRSAAGEEFLASNPGAKYRKVSSLSGGGQSISYERPAGASRRSNVALPATPQPGAPPSIETLARFRRRGVYSRPRWVGAGAAGSDAFGYGGGGIDWQPPDGLFLRDDRTGEISPA